MDNQGKTSTLRVKYKSSSPKIKNRNGVELKYMSIFAMLSGLRSPKSIGLTNAVVIEKFAKQSKPYQIKSLYNSSPYRYLFHHVINTNGENIHMDSDWPQLLSDEPMGAPKVHGLDPKDLRFVLNDSFHETCDGVWADYFL
ncbi:unnamed protein product [Medioppia subpectinata]|uniref:Uncharacterized protein n=1 Tax=Medioppia subpectinata TaxID=1979941 RepID=A0A7R9L2H0_9ACAR|nr:unnamed protein product [Medioppia subpectinata]CAG2114078.1 unnamed protein product [Medioppia subpectinata]